MLTISVSGKVFAIENVGQILGMGGPHVGDLLLDGTLISEACIANNFIHKEDLNLLFFIRRRTLNFYRYFTINFYNINSGELFEFDKEFDILYLGGFVSKNELEIYPAFHDKFKDRKLIFNLDQESFNAINNN
jgi:hypothetical protein